MSEADQMIAEATRRILQDLADPVDVNARESDDWKTRLWQAVEEAWLPLAWVSEENGGVGATMNAGRSILELAGQYALSVPLAETMIAAWLMDRSGLEAVQGAATVVPARPRDRIVLEDGLLKGAARGVPFAANVDYLVVVAHGSDGPALAVVPASKAHIDDRPGIAGDGRATVHFTGQAPSAVAAMPPELGEHPHMVLGAAARACQIGGALQAILEISVEYSKERIAFGRPIAKFQAVQHNLAELVEEAAAAIAASTSAMDTVSTFGVSGDEVFLEVAAAKIRAGEAAGKGAAIAHQVLAAIGFTDEHILQRFSKRLWDWRDDFGSESAWAIDLGRFVADRGPEELWPLVASR